MFLSWKEIEVQLCSLLWFHANFDPMTFTLTSCGGTQKSWWSFPPPPCHSVNLSNMYPFSSSCIFSADKIRSVQGGKNWSHMVPGNRILTRSVKCNLFELDVDSARIYLDLGSEVYNGYPQGCPPPPPSKHWVDDLPWGFRFVCMPLCVLWVDKLSTLTLDSCQSQTQSLSPPPPLVSSSSLSLPPPTFWSRPPH